ncbi:Meiotically up-regulated gene 72 protein [Smittium mucronatum]|uniref:2-dehydropantoate 2-reductase n=1 Tax=Smittium mucronatum TaxID=133383 RepID=A0A1R0H937_9FUNG|nr:Meiotically up-regulated gene 72 protein [Smittium mucronatum]
MAISDSDSLNFLIIGAGAVGSIFAWRLQHAGNNVDIVCRSNYEAVLQNGFQISSFQFGPTTFKPNRVHKSLVDASLSKVVYDYILVCTKSLPNIHSPADVLEGIDLGSAAIVLIQNGIGIEVPFYKRFPGNALISSITYIDTKQVESGVIEHGDSADLSFGIYDPDNRFSEESTDHTLLLLQKALLEGGIKPKINRQIQIERWYKVVWNASFNPISVVSGASNTVQLLSDPRMEALIIRAMREIISVAETYLGTSLSPEIDSSEIPERYIAMTRKRPEPVFPSMMVDYVNKRPMEHQVILKAPIDVAKSLNIDVPVLESIYAILVHLENKQLNQ